MLLSPSHWPVIHTLTLLSIPYILHIFSSFALYAVVDVPRAEMALKRSLARLGAAD